MYRPEIYLVVGYSEDDQCIVCKTAKAEAIFCVPSKKRDERRLCKPCAVEVIRRGTVGPT